ncbi:MAG: hypothetical protein IJ326_08380 [Lachnospiraceae bacterium]|nr:hypothetical protein [Lachnospiraceae bacterium]
MKVHYFQRYQTKENVDTSNTMLMLSRLYNYNSDKFFRMMNNLVLGQKESPEISFELQSTGENSVPDAVISQKSFKIVIETKLYNQFHKEQLLKHLKKFSREEIKVLLTLDPKPMNQNFKEEFEKALKEYNQANDEQIQHVNLTFQQLVGAMEDIVDERDVEIVDILEDYKQYCLDSGLIPERHKWMRAIVAGTSIEQNIELNLYYDKAERGYSEHGYIGLYKGKSIRAIGKLKKIILAQLIEGRLEYYVEQGEMVTEEEKLRIQQAIDEAEEKFGYDLKTIPHKYFIVEKFYQIDFKKMTKNPIQKSKYFNLAQMLSYDEMPDTEKIANELDGRYWEEF